MFRKGDSAFVKHLDENYYEVVVNKKKGMMYDIIFDNGSIEKCHANNLKKSRPVKSINKHNKYIKKLQDKKVDFGKFKEKNWTYRQLINNDVEYCKAIVKGFYTVPSEFKTFCCDNLIE